MRLWSVLRYGYRKRMEERSFYSSFPKGNQWADHLIFVYPIWWVVCQSAWRAGSISLCTGIAYRPMIQGALSGITSGQAIQKLLKEKRPVFMHSAAPTWWYKIFSGPLNISDSYGISVFWRAGSWFTIRIKTKRVCILGIGAMWIPLACGNSISGSPAEVKKLWSCPCLCWTAFLKAASLILLWMLDKIN